MDYEKKYNALVGQIKKAYLNAQTDSTKAVLEDILTSLAESEDERIRKEIITHCRNTRCVTEEGAERIAKWISWLEKQESVGEIVERCKTSWYNEGKIAGMAEGLTNDEKYQQGWHDAIEKQGEKSQRMISAEAKEALYDKPTWSEEDEENSKNILYILNQLKGTLIYEEDKTAENCIDWLKSLKDRIRL